MAANYQVSPPENFSFSKPEEWPKWIRRFERFRIASELDKKGEPIQVNTLVYSMGNEAEDIFHSFGLSEEDSKKYKTVKERFDTHFVARRNTIFERAKFNHRKQQEGETGDSFITALYTLVEHCSYGDLKDEMIRDRIVVGIRDSKLSEKLQLDPELTLEKAITQVRQREAVQKQQTIVREDATAVSVDAVRKKPYQHKKNNNFKKSHETNRPNNGGQNRGNYGNNKPSQGATGQQNRSTCHRCGYSPSHARERCPARDNKCQKCHRIGHYERKCKASVGEVYQQDYDSDSDNHDFLGAIDDKSCKPWVVRLSIDDADYKVDFKIDTGADVTAIPEKTYNAVKGQGHMHKLQPANRVLQGPSKNNLNVLGKFIGELSTSDNTSQSATEIFVIRGLAKPLLGRPAIERLNLVKLMGSIQSSSYKQKYPTLFTGLGKMTGEYEIKLRDDAKPYAISAPRNIAIPYLDKVENELLRLENIGVVSPVDEPTDWCAGLVVVPKKNNTVRLCVDLTHLNKSVRREKHQLPSTEETLHKLTGAKVFSKLDANSGFWQIPLTESSRLLTTFLSPFGRYAFNRLPFGISSAPEHFQKRMETLLAGLPGVLCQMDDVLIFGSTQEEHDERLESVLQRFEKANMTLNDEKCEFSRDKITFVGHVIDASGVRPDPRKVEAIVDFEAPSNVPEVRRFMGMVNQLGRFTPNLAEHSKPIRELLQKDRSWVWDQPQIQAFERIKQELSSDTVLALYDPKAPTKVSADASSYGLGAVLLQRSQGEDDKWKPVAYASRAMSSTEQRYAQVEKEALAVTWACEKFANFIIGMKFQIETDHKPLVSLLGTKAISELPPRIQRFRMRLMRYEYDIDHVPGKLLYTADALSRAPLYRMTKEEEQFQSTVEAYVDCVIEGLPASENRLNDIRKSTKDDSVLSIIVGYCENGWPGFERSSINIATRPYWQIRDELTVCQGLLMKGSRLVIPTNLRAELLQKIHDGHQGIVKCRTRARNSIWWPGINREIENLVKNCTVCVKHRSDHAEPLRPTEFPERPWQMLGSDLFQMKGANYLLVVDYFSRYIEIARLKSTTSQAIVNHLQSIFARYGIPDTLISDNGPQYASGLFQKFATDYGFRHVTSSPHYPQGNGEAERAVQTVKRLIQNAQDPYLALLAYRATPLKNGYSPAELLMGRKLRTTLPENPKNFLPQWPDLGEVREREKQDRMTLKVNFDEKHRARPQPKLHPGETVWVKGSETSGTVVKSTVNDRSYVIDTPSGQIRRNRRHLESAPMIPVSDVDDDNDSASVNQSNQSSQNDTSPVNASQSQSGASRSSPNRKTDKTPVVKKTDISNRNSSDGRVVTRSGRVSNPVKRMDL